MKIIFTYNSLAKKYASQKDKIPQICITFVNANKNLRFAEIYITF